MSKFVSLKKHLAGEPFARDVEVKQAVDPDYWHLTPISSANRRYTMAAFLKLFSSGDHFH